MNYNYGVWIGRIVAPIELKHTKDGKPYVAARLGIRQAGRQHPGGDAGHDPKWKSRYTKMIAMIFGTAGERVAAEAMKGDRLMCAGPISFDGHGLRVVPEVPRIISKHTLIIPRSPVQQARRAGMVLKEKAEIERFEALLERVLKYIQKNGLDEFYDSEEEIPDSRWASHKSNSDLLPEDPR